MLLNSYKSIFNKQATQTTTTKKTTHGVTVRVMFIYSRILNKGKKGKGQREGLKGDKVF